MVETTNKKEPKTVPDMVNHPPHYTNSSAKCECGRTIECIEITRHMNFNVGNAVKYCYRHLSKGNPIQDLRKAIFYLNDEVKRLEKESKNENSTGN